MNSITLRLFSNVTALLLVAGTLFGAHHDGVIVTNVNGRSTEGPATPLTPRRKPRTRLPSAPKNRPTNNQATRRFKMVNVSLIK
jgi:hypothetical protein